MIANNRMGRKTQQLFNWADRSQKRKGGRGNQRKSSSLRDPKWSNCFGLGSCHRSSCQRRPGRRNCNRFVKARYVAMRGIFQKPGLPKDEAFACLWVFDCLYDCICRPPELARTKVLCSFVPAWHCCTAGCYARCLGSKPPVGHQFVLGATKSTHVGAVVWVCVCVRVWDFQSRISNQIQGIHDNIWFVGMGLFTCAGVFAVARLYLVYFFRLFGQAELWLTTTICAALDVSAGNPQW